VKSYVNGEIEIHSIGTVQESENHATRNANFSYFSYN
jgi:hypothetical protein